MWTGEVYTSNVYFLGDLSMKKFLLSVVFVAIAGLAMLPADAKAFGGRKSCKDACAQPCEMTWEDRKVTCYKTVTKEKEVEVTVCKPEYRDEVRKYTTTVLSLIHI